MLRAEDIIGLTKDEAIAKLDADGATWRVVKSDDKYHVVTRDYNMWRFNLYLKDRKVYLITMG